MKASISRREGYWQRKRVREKRGPLAEETCEREERGTSSIVRQGKGWEKEAMDDPAHTT
jgi:hypothetical protein